MKLAFLICPIFIFLVGCENPTSEGSASGANICKDEEGNDTEVLTCLTALSAQGTIAGFEYLNYDNRDGYHTKLVVENFPGLNSIQTGHGFGHWSLYGDSESVPWDIDSAVIGNASLCSYLVDYNNECASLTRAVLTTNNRASGLNDLYKLNTVYWHPEHHDHDYDSEATDKLWFMIPWLPLSYGSSHSEMDEIGKFLNTAAAFKPQVRDVIMKNGLLAPTLQMIFRRTRVSSEQDYLSYKAHPNSFTNLDNQLDMVRMAYQINTTDIPPMVSMAVVEETYSTVDINDGFTTSTAIARTRSDSTGSKKITVSAEGSYDINDKALTFHWAILRGLESEIIIKPLNANSSIVEIEFLHTGERDVSSAGDTFSSIKSKLSVVGVFVNNGTYYSAPGFVTNYSSPKNIWE